MQSPPKNNINLEGVAAGLAIAGFHWVGLRTIRGISGSLEVMSKEVFSINTPPKAIAKKGLAIGALAGRAGVGRFDKIGGTEVF